MSSVATSAVDRLEAPTQEQFVRDYVEPMRPVVIGAADVPLAQRTWTFDELARTVGDVEVPVYDWGPEGPTVEDRFSITRMPLAEAIEHARGVTSTDKQRYSVCQLAIESVGDLAARYDNPPWLRDPDALGRLPLPFRERSRRALFLSFHRGIHWHNGREALAQLVEGRKRFVLFHPRDTPYLYPRRLADDPLAWFDETEAVFCSEIPFENGLEAVDLDRFPMFERATPIVVDLAAGESLYIPSHWWHFTTAIEPCVVVVEFWDAPLARWGYPIARRSLVMKPYRKYLYRHMLRLKRFSRRQDHA